MRKQVIGLLAIYCALFAAACTDKASDNIAPQWLSSEKPVYNAMCQTDTLRFRAAGKVLASLPLERELPGGGYAVVKVWGLNTG